MTKYEHWQKALRWVLLGTSWCAVLVLAARWTSPWNLESTNSHGAKLPLILFFFFFFHLSLPWTTVWDLHNPTAVPLQSLCPWPWKVQLLFSQRAYLLGIATQVVHVHSFQTNGMLCFLRRLCCWSQGSLELTGGNSKPLGRLQKELLDFHASQKPKAGVAQPGFGCQMGGRRQAPGIKGTGHPSWRAAYS